MMNYDDIIDMPHYEPRRHPRMTLAMRAAQFSPFAALTGYGEAIDETARYTDEEIVLEESVFARLNEMLHYIAENPKILVIISFFVPDARKDGGSYTSAKGVVRKIDDFQQYVQMEDGTKIDFNKIIDISFL